MEKNTLEGLNADQKVAVSHVRGPVLVVAGAGTGKTTVIAKRISYLIEKGHAKPSEILALTFTEKAASEMISRVDSDSEQIYSDLSISTFHSFGADLVSEFGLELGLPVDLKVLSDIEQVLFIRDHIFEFDFSHYKNLSNPTSLIKELIRVFSRAKDELIEPERWIKSTKKMLRELEKTKSENEAGKENLEKDLELAYAYKKYNEILAREGYIDYGDQIYLVSKLLKKASIRNRICQRHKFALIDEFQDTNYAQSQIIKQIFGPKGNVMVVGDDDQSIYRFRGAAVRNILDFRDEYQDVKTVVLTENYRTTQKILDSAYGLVQNNNPERLEFKYKIDKKLVSGLGAGEAPKLLLSETESGEADLIADIIEKKNKNGLSFSDMAILVRANSHAEEIVRTLAKRGIPFVFSGALGLYEKIEVKMLISLVRVLFDADDDLATFHLATSEVYDFPADDISKVARWASKRNRPLSVLLGRLDDLAGDLELSEKAIKLGKCIASDISELRESSKDATAGEVVNLFLKKSGYYKKLTAQAKDGSLEAHVKISNIAGFFDKIIHFQRNYKDHSLEKFGEYLNLIIDVGDDPRSYELEEGLDAVNVITAHKSKGLEFDTVFIASLSDSHFPSRGSYDRLTLPEYLYAKKDQEVKEMEERRLFYVAMTRAKKELYLSAALDYGTKKTHKLSRFVLEALGDKKVEKRFLKSEAIEKVRHFERISNFYGIKWDPIPESEIVTFSRQALDDWLTCPFKYQLIHITPIRILADANIAYGNAVHNSINEYYKRRISDKSVKKNELLELFDIFWNEAGFLSREHERARYEGGKKALSAFYERSEKEALPIMVEREFKFKVGNNIIRGRYDAVFEESGTVRIVDFKTSNITNMKDAQKKTKESKQLATYALSWLAKTRELPAEVILYYIESGIRGVYSPTLKDAEKTKKEIENACQGIRLRNFEPTPKLNVCGWCPFKFYCPAAITEKTSS